VREGTLPAPQDIPREGGVYALTLRVEAAATIRVGALREVTFEPGLYVYVGSARRGLRARLARHLRGDGRLHWHIDYLRRHARPVAVRWWTEGQECALSDATAAGAVRTVRGFGSSDCRCAGHLHYMGEG
jgi:sugar fermentation stimulation protein A